MSLIQSGLLTEVQAEVQKAEKTTGKKVAESTTTRTADKKDEDWFNAEKYIETAKKLNVMGEERPYKWAKPTIYKVMKGELTIAKAKKALVAIAEKNPKLAYYLKKVA